MKICRDCHHYKLYSGYTDTYENCMRKMREVEVLDIVTGDKRIKLEGILCCSDERVYAEWYEFNKCGKVGRYFRAKEIK